MFHGFVEILRQSRYLRVVLAVILFGAGSIFLYGDINFFNQKSANEVFEMSLATVTGFVLYFLALGVITFPLLTHRALLAIDALAILASAIAICLSYSQAMLSLRDVSQRRANANVTHQYAMYHWELQQVLQEQCHGDFGKRCSAIRKMDKTMAIGPPLVPLPDDIADACDGKVFVIQSDPEVNYAFKDACRSIGRIRQFGEEDWSDVDSAEAGLKQFGGSFVLAVLFGLTAARALLAPLISRSTEINERIQVKESTR